MTQMEVEKIYELCYTCENRRMDIKSGILCNLTGMKPLFKESCGHFIKYDFTEKKKRFSPPLQEEKYEGLRHIKSMENAFEKRQVGRAYVRIFLFFFLLLMSLSILVMILFFWKNSSRDYFIVLLSIFFVSIAGTNIFKRILYVRNRESDPFRIYLSNFGDYDTMCNKIKTEIENNTIRIGRVYITPEWIVNMRLAKIWVLKLSEVVWCYHQMNESRLGVDHYLIIKDERMVSHQVRCRNKKSIHQVIAILHDYLPGILIGYSKELEKLWSHDPLSIINDIKKRKKSKVRDC